MAKRSGKILMLFDMPGLPPADGDYSQVLVHPDWKDERDVHGALQELGYEVDLFGVYDDLKGLVHRLESQPSDTVFSLCESFSNERGLGPQIVSLLELAQVPFTGNPSAPLFLCRDKALAKKILRFHNILTPEFVVSRRLRPIRTLKDFPFPAIVKPLSLEGSEGISQESIVKDEEAAILRARFLHERLRADAIIEEYIPGRELYVGVLGNTKLTIFPPREFVIENGEPSFKVATFKAKWDDVYRRRHGIKNIKARNLSEETLESIKKTCREIYQLFQLRGYARMDLRLTDDGRLYFLEANPNPGIARSDDFAGSAKLGGMDYEELIDQIVRLAAS